MNNNYVKKGILVIYDIFCVFIAGFLSIIIVELGNDFYLKNVLIYCVFLVALTLILFIAFKLYSSLWRYASVEEFINILICMIFIFIINIVFSFCSGILNETNIRFIPFRWCLVFSMFQMFFTITSRFMFRFIRFYRNGNKIVKHKAEDKKRVMIIGAGDAGTMIIKEMKNTPSMKMLPICIIDDDKDKNRQYLEGIKIVGTRDDIVKACEIYNINHIIIAMPSISQGEIAKIIAICQETKCRIQTLPGIYQLVQNENILSKVRDIQVEDLLGREPIKINLTEINGYLSNQVVLVTGGGGSIGSELCRQIAKSNPKKLIIVDIYENNAYDIEQELLRKYPKMDLLVLIASVRDKNKMDHIFDAHRPNIVFHAAAHKHVPLMETSPNEAVKNNVFGTLNVALAADKYNVKRFIMISTDKAVNPTNVMGATKRICEMIIQEMAAKSKTEFVATRFGNVLGSNGSVIPLFMKQIAEGGPVTVTHKEITRFFMTIPEAVSLVLQAGSYAKGGEIFVLDMGKPVKIYNLAENLIKLSGYTPNVDMMIEVVGLRPGEKLYEEMLMDEEGLQKTDNKLIYIGEPINLDENLFDKLSELYDATINETDILHFIEDIVPTYHRNNKE